jgi:orotidine-5'-phosphate decarboxylase
MKPGDEPILFVALDEMDPKKVREKADSVAGEGNFGYKLNLDFLLLAPDRDVAVEHYDTIQYVIGLGKPVFFDCKMDLGKSRMKNMTASAGKHGAVFTNLYCRTGVSSMEKVMETAREYGVQILGLTVKTHETDEQCQKTRGRSLAEEVKITSGMAQEARLDGVILPGTMLSVVRDSDLLKAVPAMRPEWYEDKKANDQAQISTPYDAVKNGADICIAGSPVLKSQYKPREALEKIMDEMNEAYANR